MAGCARGEDAETAHLLAPAGDHPTGDAKNGASIFEAKCATCHTAVTGAPHKQGPNLWGIVERKAGVAEGFGFTPATKAIGVDWTNEYLWEFLANPKKFIKGTNMAFPGFKKEQDRSDLVAYLNTLK